MIAKKKKDKNQHSYSKLYKCTLQKIYLKCSSGGMNSKDSLCAYTYVCTNIGLCNFPLSSLILTDMHAEFISGK